MKKIREILKYLQFFFISVPLVPCTRNYVTDGEIVLHDLMKDDHLTRILGHIFRMLDEPAKKHTKMINVNCNVNGS